VIVSDLGLDPEPTNGEGIRAALTSGVLFVALLGSTRAESQTACVEPV
jgi:hypothetical protein